MAKNQTSPKKPLSWSVTTQPKAKPSLLEQVVMKSKSSSGQSKQSTSSKK